MLKELKLWSKIVNMGGTGEGKRKRGFTVQGKPFVDVNIFWQHDDSLDRPLD
jgi:hypothetical protein